MKNLSRRDFLKLCGVGSAGLAAMALAACAEDTTGGDQTVGTDYLTEAADAVANQDTTVVEQEIVQSEALAEKMVIQIASLEDYTPWASAFGDGVGGAIQYQIYQSLADRNGFGQEMQGVLMDSFERIDDRTCKIKLREGIEDHNGNPLTIDDYIYTINAATERGEITLLNKIEKIEKIDELTAQLQVVEGIAYNTVDMIVTQLRIVTKAAMEASPDAMATTPVGTGPYKVTNYVPASSMTLELNENYWMAPELRTANVSIANIKTIRCDVLTESAAIAVALQTGAIDYSESVNTQDLASFREGGAYAEGHGVYSSPSTSTNVLMMNAAADKPLGDVNLRKAVAWAIDTDFLCQSVNGGNNQKSVVLGGPGYPDYQEKWEEYYPGNDIEVAKAALAESAYPNGCTLEFNYIGSGGTNQDIGVIIQANLEMLGIKVNINGLPFGQFISAQNNGDWDMLMANLSSTGTLANVWSNYFSAKLNNGLPKNRVIDDTMEALIDAVMTSSGHTDENMDALWNHIMSNFYTLPLFVPMRNYVYNSDLISGLAFNMMDSFVPGAAVFNV